MAQKKVYTVICEHRNRQTEYTGTIEELIETFKYTLECGASWQHEKRCRKVNTNPKTIKGLLTALSNSVCNTQGSCFNPDRYYIKEESK